MEGYEESGGFALIAGLLFLIVLTMLGISSIGTVGLQERMAANLKEKERANEAAEVAARSAEVFLLDLSDIPDAKVSAPAEVWALDAPTGGIEGFLDLNNWAAAITVKAPPFNVNKDGEVEIIGVGDENHYAGAPQYYIEEDRFVPYTLHPDDRAYGRGRFYYQVTGRGLGGTQTAQSVVQSRYLRRYK